MGGQGKSLCSEQENSNPKHCFIYTLPEDLVVPYKLYLIRLIYMIAR